MADSNIRIDGVRETINALRDFEPQLKKVLDTEIKQALQATREAAKARYPRGSWIVGLSRKKLLGFITTGKGQKAARWGDSAPGIRAAIFEFAGRPGPGKTPQAKGMIASLTRRYGEPGRFLWDAWDSKGEAALSDIKGAVEKAERDLQARLDMKGVSY
jgi:hypothetical protein